MDNYPDSALNLLRSMNPGQISDARTRAEYGLYLSQALDKNYIKVKSDSLIAPAWEFFNKHGSPREKMLANNYYARIHINTDSLELAMPYLLEAEKYGMELSDFPQLGLIHYNLGDVYKISGNLDFAEEEYHKSLDAFLKADHDRNVFLALYAIARINSLKSDYDSAIDYYSQAKEVAVRNNFQEHILALSNAIASIHLFNKDNPHASLDEMNNTINQYNEGVIPLTFYPLLSWYHLKTENLAAAKKIVLEYLDKIDKSNTSALSSAYVLLSEIEVKNNNYKEAYYYKHKYNRIRDSLMRIKRDEKIYEIEQKYDNTLAQKEIEALRNKKKLLNIIAVLLIILIVFLIVTVEYVRKRAVRKKDQQLLDYQNYIESLKEDNNSLQKMHDALMNQLDKKNETELSLMKSLEDRFTLLTQTLEMATITEGNTELFYRKMKESLSRLSNDRSFSESLQEVVNLKYYGLIDYLKRKYPLLTNEDLDFISLISLKISRSGISTFYGYTNANTVHTRSARIRIKLTDINSSTQINRFIEEIIQKLSEK